MKCEKCKAKLGVVGGKWGVVGGKWGVVGGKWGVVGVIVKAPLSHYVTAQRLANILLLACTPPSVAAAPTSWGRFFVQERGSAP